MNFRNESSRRHIAALLSFVVLFLAAAQPASAAERNGAFTNAGGESRKIALTFDDGPHPRYTPQILEVLRQYGIRATFFFIGENVSYYREAARTVAAAGHEIGNHTYHHPHLKKIGDSELMSEISETQKIIQEVTGVTPVLFRPPEGTITARRSALLATIGLRGVLWNVDTLDWSGISKTEVVKNAMEGICGGDVILFHDYVAHPSVTAEALREIIPVLLAEGYCFVTVSELMAESVQTPEEEIPSSGASPSFSVAASSGCSA